MAKKTETKEARDTKKVEASNMSTYYIINQTTRELIRKSPHPFNIDENVQPPAPHIQLKRVDDETEPLFNPATQKLNQIFTDNDVAHTRTFSFVVVPKSQQEQDEYQEQQTDAATLALIVTEYNDLKNGVGNNAERLTRIERGLAWLLKGFVG